MDKRKIFPNISLLIVSAVILFTGTAAAQQLSYTTREVGNSWPGAPGPHMQNHASDMDVALDGTCTLKSVWDEGGHPCGTYKDGKFVSSGQCVANSKQETDNNGQSWTIENYYGRFINAPANHGGAQGTDPWRTGPVPTGTSAPYVKWSNGWEIRDIADPGAIGINRATGDLLVADNGEDQDIKIYDISGAAPVLKGTFGVKGGVWAGPTPGLKDDPLKFIGVTGVGGDQNGNLYVVYDGYPGLEGEGGGAHLFSFNPDGSLRWKFESSAFVQSGTVDPASNGTVIQGPFTRWEMDYSKTTGNDFKIAAININPFKYPDDPRLVHSTNICFAVRYINSVKYMWITDMYNNMVFVFRYDGEIAVPCAAFTAAWGWNGDEYIYNWWKYNQGRPTGGTRYLWRDKNDDGLASSDEFEKFYVGILLDGGIEVDQDGNMLMGLSNKVYKFPTNGTDAAGNLMYSAASRSVVADLGTSVGSMKYVADKDLMIVGTNSFTQAKVYTNFFSGTPVLQRTIALPPHQNNNCSGAGIAQVTADEDYIYSTYRCQNGHFTGKEGEVVVQKISDGSIVGYIIPGPEVQSHSGWIDMNLPTHPFMRSNGERIICVEEDNVGKILVYQWCPTGTCLPVKTCDVVISSVTLDSTAVVLNVDASVQLTATVAPADDCVKNTVWASSNTDVAIVDKNGLVKGIAVGTAVITAYTSDPSKTATSTVTVQCAPNSSLTDLTFSQSLINVCVGGNGQLNVGFVPANACDKKFTFTTDNASVATISATGDISGIAKGTCTITATAHDGGKTVSCVVKVVTCGVDESLRIKTAPVIDGVLSDAGWDITNTLSKVSFGANKSSAAFGTMWDSLNLYIGVRVIDSVLFSGNADIWNNDAVEIYIDGDDSKGATYDGKDRQFIQGYNNPVLFEKSGKTDGVQHAWTLIDGGFSIELAVPWTNIGITPARNMTIGFDMATDNSEDAGGRYSQVLWNGDGNDFQSTAKFGSLILIDTSAVKVVTGLENPHAETVLVFPNPTTGESLQATGLENGSYQIGITDMLGRLVYRQNSEVNDNTVKLNNLRLIKGFYILSFRNRNSIIIRKIIVE